MLSIIPINALAWGIGAIAAILLGIKMFLNSLHNENYISRYIGLFSIVIGVGMIFLSAPFLLTNDPYLLKDFQIIGQFFVYISFVFMALLLREMGFKRKISMSIILMPVVVFAGLATYFETLQETVSFNTDKNLVIWNSPEIANYSEAGLILLLVVPIGALFFKRSLQESDRLSRYKLLAIGTAYITAGLLQSYENIFAQGEESLQKAIINIVIFLVLIIVAIIPSSFMKRKHT